MRHETWTWNAALRGRVQAVTMRCLSGAWGTARWDREPCTEAVVWERLSCHERAGVHVELSGDVVLVCMLE